MPRSVNFARTATLSAAGPDEAVVKELPRRLIDTKAGTQVRVSLSQERVERYRADKERGDVFPPVKVRHDPATGHYYLEDGFHRLAADDLLARTDIVCEVRTGTLERARWEATAANKAHGLDRTQADIANACRMALQNSHSQGLSDREIGRHLGVDGKTVARYRQIMEQEQAIPAVVERTGKDGRTINTAGIGRRPPPPPVTSYWSPAPVKPGASAASVATAEIRSQPAAPDASARRAAAFVRIEQLLAQALTALGSYAALTGNGEQAEAARAALTPILDHCRKETSDGRPNRDMAGAGAGLQTQPAPGNGGVGQEAQPG